MHLRHVSRKRVLLTCAVVVLGVQTRQLCMTVHSLTAAHLSVRSASLEATQAAPLMGWFKRSVQPQQDAVVHIQENPLFTSPTAAAGQHHAAQQQQQPRASAEQLTSPDADALEVCRWQQEPQHRPAHAGTPLRAPAGLLLQPESAAAGRAAVHSSSGSGGNGIKGHVPAPLLLPADEPSASSHGQDIANEACYTLGTVHGPDSPPGPMQLPAGHSKTPARSAAHAALSTPKGAHCLSCSTPSTTANLAQDSHARGAGQHSVVSWQKSGTTSGSSSGSWSDAAASTATVSGVSLAANSRASPAATLPGTPTHKAAGSRRQTSVLQRQVQVMLQQQQQGSGSAAGVAAGADTEDALFEDMCACFGNLQAAAQLARTESGMTAEKLPAAIAAVRASTDGVSCSSSIGGSRPSSSIKHPSAASAASAATGMHSGGGSSSRPAAASAAGAAPAGSLAATFAAIDTSRSSQGAAGSVGGGRQLERGRSRLQASTSNANLLFEDVIEDEGEEYINHSSSPPPDSRNSSSATGSPTGSLVLLKLGPNGKSVALPNGSVGANGVSSGSQDQVSRVSAGQGRGSSSSSSAGSPGSSRDSSVHDGVRSKSTITTLPASAGAAAAAAAASGGAGVASMHGAGSRVQESQQEQQQRALLLQQEQQRALLLQQEQQRLQERRQQKQEQVVASYSPHSPMAGRTSRPSFGAGEPSAGSSSRGNSRPSSGTWALPAGRSSATGGDASSTATVLAAGGARSSSPAAQSSSPGNSADALEQLRSSSSSGVLGASMPHGMRPASGSVGGSSAVLQADMRSSGSSPVSAGVAPGASSSVQQRQGVPAAGSLQAPLPPSSSRVLSAGVAPSPRAKSAQRSVVAAASLAGIGQ